MKRFTIEINTPSDLAWLLAVQFINVSKQCLSEKRDGKSDVRNTVRVYRDANPTWEMTK